MTSIKNKSILKTNACNRIYARKFYIWYKDIISFDDDDFYSVEQHIYDSLCERFKKNRNENMRYLILKSPKRQSKLSDIHVYFEFDVRKSIYNSKKVEVMLENLNKISLYGGTYTRVGEYKAIKNRNSFLSSLLQPLVQHHRSIWKGYLNFRELPPKLVLPKNVLLYQEKTPNRLNWTPRDKPKKRIIR
jgi:hypothetical protein